MATKSRILSSLVLTAATLVIVPLSSDEASARSSSGARPSAAVRSSPAVSSKARTVTTSSQHKVNAAPVKLKTSQTTLKAKTLREVETGKGDKGDKIGKIEKEKHPHKRRHLIYPVLGVVPAPVAVDPPGCVYERRVEKLPGGGLQRVIVKVCPGA